MMWDLRLGDWREALADVDQVDAVICDPPYSTRTEHGFRSGASMAARGMGYDPINEDWARVFVDHWHPRCTGWIVVCGDHISIRWFEAHLQRVGRYVFPPVVIVKRGAAPRLAGDGPGSQCEYMMVARPREKRFMSWGSLPGWYVMDTVRNCVGDSVGVSGAKHPAFMRRLVQDYSRPGDLIVDPTAGGGTTLLAAVQEGRRAVGAEIDPSTHARATERLTETLRQGDIWTRAINVSEKRIVQELPW
jgi:site-specific DNA-methyltransferase (adenine-specific)